MKSLLKWENLRDWTSLSKLDYLKKKTVINETYKFYCSKKPYDKRDFMNENPPLAEKYPMSW